MVTEMVTVFPVVFTNVVQISDTENLRHHRHIFFQELSISTSHVNRLMTII